ncbi:hypothetical protein Fmac_009065 [Flemingia macrophylla]|uniref:VQ domain-containing protein n=1 Tax=Flemingia macrophylla TaxID=520843 RepID=A0ABD1MZ63_9FABA
MGLRRESPKIVQIETRYVQTDAVNFRDVVQSLTGKNSSTDWIGRNNAVAASENVVKGGVAETRKLLVGAASRGSKETMLPNSSMQMMNNVNVNVNVPFIDFDAFLLPPMEMMPWCYS